MYLKEKLGSHQIIQRMMCPRSLWELLQKWGFRFRKDMEKLVNLQNKHHCDNYIINHNYSFISYIFAVESDSEAGFKEAKEHHLPVCCCRGNMMHDFKFFTIP